MINMQTSDEWAQNYLESTNIIDESSFNDPDNILTDYLNHGPARNTSPKVRSVSKPIRRRSRASKKTVTTILKTHPKNFRALVQQFTGYHAVPSDFGPHHKGPINLDFRQHRYSSEKHQHDQEMINYYDQGIKEDRNLQRVSSGQSFIANSDRLFSSTVNVDPALYPLTFDDFVVDYSLPQDIRPPGSGNYHS